MTRAVANPTYGGQAKTLMTKGVCEIRAGLVKDAEASFARSYQLDATNPIAGYNLAALLFKRGEYERAQFYIRRLNATELANAETLWLGIKIEKQLKNPVVADQLAQQLQRRFPDSSELRPIDVERFMSEGWETLDGGDQQAEQPAQQPYHQPMAAPDP